MNIVIIDCFDTWEHRVDLLYKVLKSEGHSITCLLSDFRHIEKIRRNDSKQDTILFTAEPYQKNISPARLHSHVQLSADIFSWVENRKATIDLLWILAPPNSFVKDAAKIKRAYPGIKLVIDLIDLWPETMPTGKIKLALFPWKRLRNEYLNSADVVVTECNMYQEKLEGVVDKNKMTTLYLARENKGYKPDLHLSDEKISLCYLGSINNIIDIESIVEIIREFGRRKKVILHIIGHGEKKGKLIEAVENAGAEVVDHGKIYDRELKQAIFDACHYGLNIMKDGVCVGLTMKSIDYFEFGLPIINNIKGDTWDVVEKECCGLNWGRNVTRFNIIPSIQMRESARNFFERCLTEDVFRTKINKIVTFT